MKTIASMAICLLPVLAVLTLACGSSAGGADGGSPNLGSDSGVPDAGPPIAARYYAGTWHGSEGGITDCDWFAPYNIPFGQDPDGLPPTCTNPAGPPNVQDYAPATLVVTYVDDARLQIHGDVSCGSMTDGPIFTLDNPDTNPVWGNFTLDTPTASSPAYTCTGATATCASVTLYLLSPVVPAPADHVMAGRLVGNYQGTGFMIVVAHGVSVGCGETHTWYRVFQSFKKGGL